VSVYPAKYLATRHDRNTRLIWCLLSVIFITLPHFLHMPVWISGWLLGACFWRLLIELRNKKLPSAWLRLPLVLVGFSMVASSYRGITGVEAGSALLIVMLALKLLETSKPRDLTVVTIIGWFLMFSVFLREQEMWALVYIPVACGLSLGALIQTRRTGPVLPNPLVIKQAAILMVQALPVMLVLFFLFPRIDSPFWSLPTAGKNSRTGLSDTVNPGDISELGRDDSPAFRVRFAGAVPPPEERYWRGPVMGYFDGRSWSWMDRGIRLDGINGTQADGVRYEYEITLEPHGRRWLLALETPAVWSQSGASLTKDLQLINNLPVKSRLAYTATSETAYAATAVETPMYLGAMRYLPDNSNERTVEFAQKLRAESIDDREYLNKILQRFREQEYYYTLSPPRLGDDSIDKFLFDTKQGFCEHYASAFAVLARAAGIPSRVVTGYLGGEPNPLSDYWIVRQSDAHAWTEVWIDRQWLRVDPTAAVAPERIELGIDEALPDRDISMGRTIMNFGIISQAVLSWDAVNAAWNRWVLAFGPDAQRALLSNLGIRKPEQNHLIIFMFITLMFITGVLAWYLRYSIKVEQDPVLKAYKKFCGKLKKCGLAREQYEAPSDYCQRVTRARPELKTDVELITTLYLQLRYENRISERRTAEFFRLIRGFRPVTASR